jgi:hypothetical protein
MSRHVRTSPSPERHGRVKIPRVVDRQQRRTVRRSAHAAAKVAASGGLWCPQGHRSLPVSEGTVTIRPTTRCTDAATENASEVCAVSRRPNPERIDDARRAATRNRLIGEGMTEATADAWIAAWAAQATRDGRPRDGAYWNAAWRWVAAERQHRRSRNPGGKESGPLAPVARGKTVSRASRSLSPPGGLGLGRQSPKVGRAGDRAKRPDSPERRRLDPRRWQRPVLRRPWG